MCAEPVMRFIYSLNAVIEKRKSSWFCTFFRKNWLFLKPIFFSKIGGRKRMLVLLCLNAVSAYVLWTLRRCNELVYESESEIEVFVYIQERCGSTIPCAFQKEWKWNSFQTNWRSFLSEAEIWENIFNLPYIGYHFSEVFLNQK